MSDYQFTEAAKREYLQSFEDFLSDKTEFDESVQEILIEDLQLMLDATDTYQSAGKIALDNPYLSLDPEEKQLAESIGAFIDYELFFDDSITLVFGSKLVYQLRTPEADAAVDDSNLRRFDVPFGTYRFSYIGDAFEEI